MQPPHSTEPSLTDASHLSWEVAVRVATKIAVKASRSPEGKEHRSTAASITVTLSVRWGHQTVSSFIFSAVFDVQPHGARLTAKPKKVRFAPWRGLRRTICGRAKTCQPGAWRELNREAQKATIYRILTESLGVIMRLCKNVPAWRSPHHGVS